MLRSPSRSGQASLEYAGALTVVALVLSALGVATARFELARPVATAMKAAVCRVTGAICTPDGRDPCVVRARLDGRDVTFWAVAEARFGAQLLVERFSDGTAAVGFADAGSLGLAYGYGVALGAAGEAGVEVAGGLRFVGGRRWHFRTWPEAQRFVARHAERESLRGELEAVLRLPCRGFVCGPAPARPQDPDEEWLEGGTYSEASGGIAIAAGRPQPVAGATIELSDERVLGRRMDHRTGERTVYVRVDQTVTGALGAVVGSLSVAPGAKVVAEYTRTRAGQPLRLRLTGLAELHVGGGLGHQLDLPGIAEHLRRNAQLATATTDERGDRVEAAVELDLRDPELAGTARRFLAALHPERGANLGAEAARLGAALDRSARVELRTYGSARRGSESELSGSANWKVGGATRTVDERHTLTGAWTRDPGDVLLEREDCLPLT